LKHNVPVGCVRRVETELERSDGSHCSHASTDFCQYSPSCHFNALGY
jgi:hypothetical protein